MNTTVVGRVAVRVLPDTSGFKERLRRDLAKETAGVDAEVPVDANLDADALERELRAKVEELKNKFVVKLRSQIDDLKGQVAKLTKQAEAQSKADPVTIKAQVDSEDLAKDITRTIKLTTDDRDLLNTKSIRDSFLRINAMEEKHLRDLEAARRRHGIREVASMRERLATMAREMKRLYSAIKVKVRPVLDRAAAAATKVELEVWFKRLKVFTTEVRAVLNRRSVQGVSQGLQVLSGVRLFKNLVSLEPFKNIDEQLPKIALMATLIGQASSFMLSLSSDALTLGRSLGAIVPAALALPGIFVATGVALYAIIKPLSEFNDRIPEMAKGLSAMQDGMVDAFWRNAEKGMRSLAGLLPTLISGFRIVGGAAGTFMGTLAKSTSTRLKSSLMPFLTAIGTSFASLTKAAPSIARIIGNFTDLGTSYLPRLVTATEGVIKRFGTFFDASMKNGKAFEWVDRGISNIKALGGVVAGTYRIMDGLSAAAEKAGGATLHDLAAGLDRIQRVVKSDSFQSGLINVFASSRIAIEEMSRIAGPAVTKMFANMAAGADEILPRIGRVAGTLASFFARIAGDPAVGGGLIHFFDGLQSALNRLDPSVANVAKGIGGVLKVLGKMLSSFAPIVEVALGAVAKHAEGMLASVERIIESLSSGLNNFLRSLMPAIDALSPAILGIAEDLAKGIGGTLSALGPIISTLLQAISPALHLLSQMPPVVQLLAVAFGVLAVALGRLALKFAPTIVAAKGVRGSFDAARGAVTRAGDAIRRTAQHSGGLKGALASATIAVGNLGSRVPGLIAGLGRLAGAFAGVVTGAGLLSAGMKGPAAGVEEISLAMQKLAKNGDLGGFDRQFQNTKNLISRGASDIKDAFEQLSFEKYMKLDGLNKALDGFIGQLWGFKTSAGEMRDILARLDSELASLYQQDPSGATKGFEAIKEKALAAGWSVEDLDATFVEFKSAVERNAGGAAGAFGTSVNKMADDARRLQDEVFGTMDRQERQIGVLSGKNKAKVAAELAKARTQMLSELAKTSTGTDAAILSGASALNSKIAAKAAELKKNLGTKSQAALQTELDKLIADYRTKFGDLPNLLDGAEGGSLSAAISKMVGTGITPEAQAGVKASIVSPVNAAVVEAKAKVAELKTLTIGLDLATPVRAAFNLAVGEVSAGATRLVVAARTAVAGIAGQTSGLASSLTGPIKATASAVFSGTAEALGGYTAAFAKKTAEASAAVTKMISSIKSSTKFSLEGNGSAVGASYVRGLRSQIPAIIAAAKAMTKATEDNKGPLSYDKVMLIPQGKAVVQGFIKGLLSEVGTVEKTMQDITALVAGTEFDDAMKQATKSANNASVLGGLSVGNSQYITQVGDVTIDVSDLDGVKTIDDFGRTLRRKRRQRGGGS